MRSRVGLEASPLSHAGLSRMLALMPPVYVPAIPAIGLLSPGRRSSLLRMASRFVKSTEPE